MKEVGCGTFLFWAFAIYWIVDSFKIDLSYCVISCLIIFSIWYAWVRHKTKSAAKQDTSKQDIVEPTIPAVPVDQLTGKEYERYVGEKLCRLGYTLIRYTPDSGDYGADIIMKNPDGEKSCIQCKRYKKSVGVSAVQEIVAAKGYYGCTEAVVATTAAFTPSARELAERNGVRLLEHFR